MEDTYETGMTFKRKPGRPKRNPEGVEVAPQADDLKEFHQYCALRLELAANMRAGLQDSDSRHQEVAKQIKDVLLAVVQELRSK